MTPLDGSPVLTAAAMRAAEQVVIEAGTSVEELMRRAGVAVAEQVRRLAAGAEVLVLCGPGNNGGDGYVAAATLAREGLAVRLAAAGEPRSDAARAARALWSGPVEAIGRGEHAAVVVDGLFGTGLTRGLDEGLAGCFADLVSAARLSVAIDLPSGVSTDTAATLSALPHFDVTLALGALKPAHLLQPAAARCGAVMLLDIGVRAESDVTVLSRPMLPQPAVEAHKYSRGMVAVVAGAMAGAAALAAGAAARSGAGYVLLLGSATDRLPHAIVRRRLEADALDDPRIGAVVVGPGLGRGEAAQARLQQALDCDRPLVIDGDALRLANVAQIAARAAPTILTPHAGEFDALFGTGAGSKIDRTIAAARASGATVVFKGPDNVVAQPDGRARVAIAASSWLSTAGTGDVLAGIIAARFAIAGDPFEAACAGVWLHGAATRKAGAAFIADGLIDALPHTIAQCR